MSRLFLVITAALLLFSGLASWQIVKCTGMSCGAEKREICVSEKGCSKPVPGNNGCGTSKDANPPCCCVCFGNGCYFLLPVHDFRLRSFPDEEKEKPGGNRHLSPQSFHPSIWHPPAAALA